MDNEINNIDHQESLEAYMQFFEEGNMRNKKLEKAKARMTKSLSKLPTNASSMLTKIHEQIISEAIKDQTLEAGEGVDDEL